MLSPARVHEVIATAVVVPLIVVAFRRSAGLALAVVLAALIASNSSIPWVKAPYLEARWAALITLAALLLPEVLRFPSNARRELWLLAILTAICLISAVWSVEPRLTVERTTSFGIMLWIIAGCGLRWMRKPRDLEGFVDGVAVLAAAVVALSLVAAAVTSRSSLDGQFRGVFENPNGLGLFLGLTFPLIARAFERRGLIAAQFVSFGTCATLATVAHARSGLVVLFVTGVGFALSRRLYFRAAGALVAGIAVVSVTALFVGGLTGGTAPPVTSTSPSPTPSTQPSKVPSKLPSTLPSKRPRANTTTAPPAEPLLERATGARNEAWSATLRLIENKPLLGYGFGTGDRIFARFPKEAQFRYFEGANSTEAYLQLILELGLLGPLIAVPLLAAAGVGGRLLASGSSLDGSSLALVLIGGLLTGFVECVFTTAGAPWSPLIWGSAAGCVACRPRNALSA